MWGISPAQPESISWLESLTSVVGWLAPYIVQGLVTALAGVYVGYRLFKRDRQAKREDLAGVIVAHLREVLGTLLVSRAEITDNTLASISNLQPLANYLETYENSLLPNLGTLGREFVDKVSHFYMGLRVLTKQVEYYLSLDPNLDGIRFSYSTFVRDNNERIYELAEASHALWAELASEFDLTQPKPFKEAYEELGRPNSGRSGTAKV